MNYIGESLASKMFVDRFFSFNAKGALIQNLGIKGLDNSKRRDSMHRESTIPKISCSALKKAENGSFVNR